MPVRSGAGVLRNPVGPPVFTPVPSVLGIEITGHCALKCRHCFNESGPGVRGELPLQVVEHVLDEAVSWGLRHVRVSGGEPTMHAQFREVIAACRRRELHASMNSNGVYSAEMLEWLKTAPISLFLISVDGMEEHNDAIRGHGVFRRAIASCVALRHAGRNVTVALHVANGSARELDPLAEIAAGIGAGLKISPIRPIGRALLEAAAAPAAEMAETVREVARLRAKYPDLKIATDFDIAGDQPPCGTADSCAAGRSMVNIGFDGGIYPCAFLVTPAGEFRAGNVYTDSITAVWRESSVFEPFRVHTKCATCSECAHYTRRCNGGCPAVAYFAGRGLDGLDPTCPVGAGVLP